MAGSVVSDKQNNSEKKNVSHRTGRKSWFDHVESFRAQNRKGACYTLLHSRSNL